MAFDLVITPTFDQPISVPAATDDGAVRASDVVRISGNLANRDAWLKQRTDNLQTQIDAIPDPTPPPDLGPYGRKDTANTWTQTQQINGSLNIRSGGNLDLDTGAVHAGGEVTGSSLSTTGSGNINAAGGTISGNVLHSDSDTNVGGDCVVTGDTTTSNVTATDTVTAVHVVSGDTMSLPGTSRIEYLGSDADRRRHTMLNIFGGTISSTANDWTVDDDKISAGSARTFVRLAIRLPQGAQLESFILYYQEQQQTPGGQFDARVVRKELSWPSANSGQLGSAQHTITTELQLSANPVFLSPRYYETVSTPLGTPLTIDNGSNDYTLVVEITYAVGALYAAKLIWLDPGPRETGL